MTIKYAKRFVKQLKKLQPAERQRFYARQAVLEENPAHRSLNHHILKGRYEGYHSINIGGDIRALYVQIGDEIILFELIGSHSQLYRK